jgi:hypothetical protein
LFKKRFRAAVIAAATAIVGVAAYAGLGPVPGGASSHREAPLISADPQADTTDLYAFVAQTTPTP